MNSVSKVLGKKRAAWPRVAKAMIKGREYWSVDARVGDGKNGRRYYRQTREEADTLAEQLRVQRQNEGDSAFPARAGKRLEHSVETRRRISEAKQKNFAEGRETGFKDEDYHRRVTPLANCKMRGSQHFGRMRRGLSTHARAKTYEIESPEGVRHRISNLDAWCRQNESSFPPDTVPRKQPLWMRAAAGIRVQAVDGSMTNQWRGWRLVTVVGPASKE